MVFNVLSKEQRADSPERKGIQRIRERLRKDIDSERKTAEFGTTPFWSDLYPSTFSSVFVIGNGVLTQLATF